MSTKIDAFVRKIREATNPYLAPLRREKLKRTDFSIISNNCWAGSVYRYLGLPYQSPTAGLYFFASDYVRFVSDLRSYLSADLLFVPAGKSAHSDELDDRGELTVPVAKLGDIEIVFLHYGTPEEAKEKWDRRTARVNWNNLFIKFSQMNDCTAGDLSAFDSLSFHNKVCFTVGQPDIACGIQFPGYEGLPCISNDTDRFNCCLDIISWLNQPSESY